MKIKWSEFFVDNKFCSILCNVIVVAICTDVMSASYYEYNWMIQGFLEGQVIPAPVIVLCGHTDHFMQITFLHVGSGYFWYSLAFFLWSGNTSQWKSTFGIPCAKSILATSPAIGEEIPYKCEMHNFMHDLLGDDRLMAFGQLPRKYCFTLSSLVCFHWCNSSYIILIIT